MKWVLIVPGVIVGLVALMALIGALLPKNHIASRSAKYKKSADDIWFTITDFAAAPSWRTDLKGIEKLSERDGHEVWVEISKHGRMPFQVTEFEPPNRLVTEIIADKLPFGGSWTFEISELDSGSLLTITENGEIYNPIFRFMARFIFGYHRTIKNYLKALGRKFGDEIEIIESAE
ncbi:MAG: SRPBCC family protein [bacterium]